MARNPEKFQVNVEIDQELADLLDAAQEEFGGVGGDLAKGRATIVRAVLRAALPGWIEIRRAMRDEERERMHQSLNQSLGKAPAEPLSQEPITKITKLSPARRKA